MMKKMQWIKQKKTKDRAKEAYDQLQSEIDSGIGQSKKVKELIDEKDKTEKALAETTQKLDSKKLPLQSLEKAMNEAKATYTDLKRQQRKRQKRRQLKRLRKKRRKKHRKRITLNRISLKQNHW